MCCAAGGHETCRFGQGVVPIEQCVRILKEIGYDGRARRSSMNRSRSTRPRTFAPAWNCSGGGWGINLTPVASQRGLYKFVGGNSEANGATKLRPYRPHLEALRLNSGRGDAIRPGTVDVDRIIQLHLRIAAVVEPGIKPVGVADGQVDAAVTLAVAEQIVPVGSVQADAAIEVHDPGDALERVGARRAGRAGHGVVEGHSPRR